MTVTSRRDGESHHVTEAGAVRALWSMRHGRTAISWLHDAGSTAPGYRWPDTVHDEWPAGDVAFPADAYPTVAQAREWLPQYAALWDAIEAEAALERQPDAGPESAAARHSEFFGLPTRI